MSKDTLATLDRLTKIEEDQLDSLLETIFEYLNTPEGEETFAALQKLMGRVNPGITPQQELTDREETTLRFIRKELRCGHSPSVRELGRLLKLRSSRSAFKVIQNLILKKQIRRNGKLLKISDLP